MYPDHHTPLSSTNTSQPSQSQFHTSDSFSFPQQHQQHQIHNNRIAATSAQFHNLGPLNVTYTQPLFDSNFIAGSDLIEFPDMNFGPMQSSIPICDFQQNPFPFPDQLYQFNAQQLDLQYSNIGAPNVMPAQRSHPINFPPQKQEVILIQDSPPNEKPKKTSKSTEASRHYREQKKEDIARLEEELDLLELQNQALGMREDALKAENSLLRMLLEMSKN
eukprot:TRINITY_DN8347_c0_g1_i1.p1 TRINITY_DN8347_c0_g1~~TRINITY_DN8347_c0_g1_i1.p1  ORF type:complete len:234 (-),score=43.36 TRINITY_DN8347_c0_g1_i1:19-675(-)